MKPVARLIYDGRHTLEVTNNGDRPLVDLRLLAGPDPVQFFRGDEYVSSVDVPPNTTLRVPVAMTAVAELRLRRQAQVRWSVAGELKAAPVLVEI